MIKEFKFEVCCPNCALKSETALRGVEGIKSASVNIMKETLSLEFEAGVDLDEVLKKANKVVKKIDSDLVIK